MVWMEAFLPTLPSHDVLGLGSSKRSAGLRCGCDPDAKPLVGIGIQRKPWPSGTLFRVGMSRTGSLFRSVDVHFAILYFHSLRHWSCIGSKVRWACDAVTQRMISRV